MYALYARVCKTRACVHAEVPLVVGTLVGPWSGRAVGLWSGPGRAARSGRAVGLWSDSGRTLVGRRWLPSLLTRRSVGLPADSPVSRWRRAARAVGPRSGPGRAARSGPGRAPVGPWSGPGRALVGRRWLPSLLTRRSVGLPADSPVSRCHRAARSFRQARPRRFHHAHRGTLVKGPLGPPCAGPAVRTVRTVRVRTVRVRTACPEISIWQSAIWQCQIEARLLLGSGSACGAAVQRGTVPAVPRCSRHVAVR